MIYTNETRATLTRFNGLYAVRIGGKMSFFLTLRHALDFIEKAHTTKSANSEF